MFFRTTQKVRVLLLLGSLCICGDFTAADDPVIPANNGVTFSHVYKIDLPKASDCKVEMDTIPVQDQGTEQAVSSQGMEGDNNIVFRHNIRLQTPKCDCESSESFQALLYRINGLEEEVTYLKSQCTQGCCGGGGSDIKCSGHGSLKQDTCSCVCDEGWEGEDCSRRSCPNECSDNGRCVDGQCVCYQGYAGADCSELLCPNDCNDKGRCVDGVCQCFRNFMGEDCSLWRCPNDCSGNGECDDGTCICEDGFTGIDCSKGKILIRNTVCESCAVDTSDRHLSQPLFHIVLILMGNRRGSEESRLKVRWQGRVAGSSSLVTLSQMKWFAVEIKVRTNYHSVICKSSGGARNSDHSISFTLSTLKTSPSIKALRKLDSVMGPNNLRLLRSSEESLLVEWDEVPGAEYYLLTYHPEGDEGSIREIRVPSDTNSYLITGLTPGVKYIINVSAWIKGITSYKDVNIMVILFLLGPHSALCQQISGFSLLVEFIKKKQKKNDKKTHRYNSSKFSKITFILQNEKEVLCYQIIKLLFFWPAGLKRLWFANHQVAAHTVFPKEVSTVQKIRVVSQTEDSIQVEWPNPSSEVDYFRLTFVTPEGQEQEVRVQKSSGAKTSYTITDLFPGTKYLIKVQAIKGNTAGKPSSVNGLTGKIPACSLTENTMDSEKLFALNVVETVKNPGCDANKSFRRPRHQVKEKIVVQKLQVTGRYFNRPDPLTEFSTACCQRRDTQLSVMSNYSGILPFLKNLLSLHCPFSTILSPQYNIPKVSESKGKGYASVLTQMTLHLQNFKTHKKMLTSKSFRNHNLERLSYRTVVVYIFLTNMKALHIDAPTNLVTKSVTEDTATLSWLTGLRPGVEYTVYIWAVKGDRKSKRTSTQSVTGHSFSICYNDNVYFSFGPLKQMPETSLNKNLTSKSAVFPREYTSKNELLKFKIGHLDKTLADIDAPTNLVTKSVTEDTATLSWDRVPYKLTGLRPGVEYTVYIWAVKGDRKSKRTSTQAVTEIDAPTNLKVEDVQLNSGVLTWTPPLAVIDGYTLSYKAEDGSGQITERRVGPGERRFTLDGLELGKKYIVSLVAFRRNQRSRTVETTFTTVGVLFPFPMDCKEVLQSGNNSDGVYTIYLNNDRSKPMEVYCDMTTDGGGWIVLQRRNSGKLDFLKRWKQYIQGFGNLTDEFWLGLEKIYELTNTNTQYELRVDLKAGSESVYAVYDNFKIAPVRQKFKLTIGNYRGTAGDAMTYHQGRPFSTIDQDNDIALSNCALTHRGAWWYKNCHLANLNGRYGDDTHSVGVNWEPWKGHEFSIPFAEMKIRPHVASDTPVLGRKKRSLGG
uniref:Tenascin N n=1 Tax=Lepisosteus oculatus TaxID=7918 RepID=W5M354_LEPOC